MNLLLDTHILLWAAEGTLPQKAAILIADENKVLYFSPASIWEIAIKNGLGRPDFVCNEAELYQGLLRSGYLELPIESKHVLQIPKLPDIHKDPFDRILVAQATSEKMTLVTADKAISLYPISVVHV